MPEYMAEVDMTSSAEDNIDKNHYVNNSLLPPITILNSSTIYQCLTNILKLFLAKTITTYHIKNYCKLLQSLVGAECASTYKTSIKAEIVLPTTVDAIKSATYDTITFLTAVIQFNLIRAINTVVVTDYVTKIMMKIVSQEFKENYIDPRFNYIFETSSELSGLLQNYIYQHNEL